MGRWRIEGRLGVGVGGVYMGGGERGRRPDHAGRLHRSDKSE